MSNYSKLWLIITTQLLTKTIIIIITIDNIITFVLFVIHIHVSKYILQNTLLIVTFLFD